jgi:isoleucyl-tRNA synthetase
MMENDLLVGVYTLITKDLESEGLARDLVRRIQALRKEANFEIDDKIIVYYASSTEVEKVFNIEANYIKSETLSDELIKGKAPTNAITHDYNIDGIKVKLSVIKNG